MTVRGARGEGRAVRTLCVVTHVHDRISVRGCGERSHGDGIERGEVLHASHLAEAKARAAENGGRPPPKSEPAQVLDAHDADPVTAARARRDAAIYEAWKTTDAQRLHADVTADDARDLREMEPDAAIEEARRRQTRQLGGGR